MNYKMLINDVISGIVARQKKKEFVVICSAFLFIKIFVPQYIITDMYSFIIENDILAVLLAILCTLFCITLFLFPKYNSKEDIQTSKLIYKEINYELFVAIIFIFLAALIYSLSGKIISILLYFIFIFTIKVFATLAAEVEIMSERIGKNE